MDITKLSFIPRRRTAWEVFDLTQIVVRTNFWGMMKIVALLYTPLGLALWAIFSAETASYIIWWLKPVLERPLLDFLAKNTFSQPASAWSCISSLKKLSVTDVFTSLTINRFSPNRAYLSPITQLEKLKGSDKRSRKNILLFNGQHRQTFWMIFCVHIEMLFTFLLVAIFINFIPQGVAFDDQFNMSNMANSGFAQIYFLSYLLTIQVIAPYFVTGGFLGYLNTRVNIEAWDIELAFKQIANKVAKISKVAVVALLFTFSFYIDSPVATAAESASITSQTQIQKNPPSQALTPLEVTKKSVDSIYQEHALIEKSTFWKPVIEENEEDTSWDLRWLKNLFSAVAGLESVVGYLFWLIVISLTIWVVYKIYAMRGLGRFNLAKAPSTTKQKRTESSTFFTTISHSNWPDDLLLAAQKASDALQFREALTYILRFSLLWAEKHSSIIITSSMTEKECEAALMVALPKSYHTQYQQLFSTWIQQAWAHKKASKHQVDELITTFRETDAKGVTTHE